MTYFAKDCQYHMVDGQSKRGQLRLSNLVAKVIMGRLDSFVEAQHLSNIIWAFATSKIVHKPLFEAVHD
jgi:hypothetical protein